MAKVSACITYYNRANKLKGTLESLLNQTRKPDEVLLWDDCSPDDPSEIIDSYRDKFTAFQYHRNSKNLNMPANLNAVISRATGDLVANIHDADQYAPSYLEKLCDVLEQHPRVGFAFCGIDSTRDGIPGSRVWTYNLPQTMSGPVFFKEHFLYSWSSKVWGTVVARRSMYETLMPFNPKYRNWSDVDMWMRASATYDVGYVNEPMIITDNAETSLRKFSWYKVLVMHQMVCENIVRHLGDDPKESYKALKRRRHMLWRRWLRHLAAGFIRGDFSRFNGLLLPLKSKAYWRFDTNEISWSEWKP